MKTQKDQKDTKYNDLKTKMRLNGHQVMQHKLPEQFRHKCISIVEQCLS